MSGKTLSREEQKNEQILRDLAYRKEGFIIETIDGEEWKFTKHPQYYLHTVEKVDGSVALAGHFVTLRDCMEAVKEFNRNLKSV